GKGRPRVQRRRCCHLSVTCPEKNVCDLPAQRCEEHFPSARISNIRLPCSHEVFPNHCFALGPSARWFRPSICILPQHKKPSILYTGRIVMKHVLCWLCGLLLLSGGTLGCNRSPKGGEGKETFRLSGPTTSTTIVQGQSAPVTITIRPSKSFKEHVKLEARPLEDGLQVTLDQNDVKANGENQDVKLTVTAASDATEGKHTVKITARPEKGEA